jgi:hypothetical protein
MPFPIITIYILLIFIPLTFFLQNFFQLAQASPMR